MPQHRFRDRARTLRRDQSQPEMLVWNLLRDRRLGGWKWKRQVPRGDFIVDFYCAELALVVEIDGPHHALQRGYDSRRTKQLQAEGLRVERFSGDRVFEDLEELRFDILDLCGGERPLT